MDIKQLKQLCEHFTLLYVEDDPEIAAVFTSYLKKLFKEVIYKQNGLEGLQAYKQYRPDLIITDIQMPKLNGLEMTEQIKQLNEEQIILVVSAYSDSKKLIDSIKIGVDGYILKPVDYNHLNEQLYKTLSKLKKVREHAIYEKALHELVDEKTAQNILLEHEKVENYEQTLYALIDIVESRDSYTGKHSVRVAKYAKMIAQQMDLSKEEVEDLYKASMLHDLGKIGIPDSLLLKPGKLTQQEFTLIKEHVNIGFHMLEQIPMFKNIAQIINTHHERFDGSGYPHGLKADEIPLGGHILAVADSFDAMTTNRIYKNQKDVAQALEEIRSFKGTHYEANVVEAALQVLKDIDIDSRIDQLPHTTLEEERFSFFYKDALCKVYNETYFNVVLAKNANIQQYHTLHLIALRHFGQYNKENGWSQGNLLLQKVAQHLKDIYEELIIFRVHGDDFIILSTQDKPFDASKLESLERILENTPLHIHLDEFDIQKHHIDTLEKLEILL